MRWELARWQIVVAAILLAVGVGLFFFVRYYEGPLKEGKIVEMKFEPGRIYYTQDEITVYREDPRSRVIHKTRKVTVGTGDNKREYDEPYEDIEHYTEKIFDHYEYSVKENIDGADFIITMQAPSKKRDGVIRSATFFTTEAKYKQYQVGEFGNFNRKQGDRWMDPNNSSREVNRSRYPFDMSVKQYQERLLTTEGS
jgi:hypothetical protein